MLGNKLCHLKHINCALSAKNNFQLVVSIDVPSVGLILQVILFDILPQFFNNLGTRHWSLAYHSFQFWSKPHRL